MTADWMNEDMIAGDDDVRSYLRQIRRFPRLTPEQERDLARRCAEGDEEAIRQMVDCNLRLVVSIAREYAGRGVPMMDLIQEGSIGLLAAAKKFDYTLDFRFSTYATKWIRQGVTRSLMNHGLIRLPIHATEKIRKLQSVRNALLQRTGQEPKMETVAALCDLPVEKAEELLRLSPEVCSLDAPVGNEDGTLGLYLENVHAAQPYESLVREELTQLLEELMSALNARQRQILQLRYGMQDGNCYSLEQVGKMLGISKERVRQIEKQAMEKLHKSGSAMGLEDFLE